MEQKRIIRGNNTVFPTGAEVLGTFATNAVTDRSVRRKNGQMLSNELSVIEARRFNEEHQT